MRRAAALSLALAAATATHVVAQDATPPFVVGVWGDGDAIIPFADFDGRRWRSSWPGPAEINPESRPLQRIPAAWWGSSIFQPTWELIESTGRRRTIQITGTDSTQLGSSCSPNLGLKTDVPANTYEYGTVLAANRAGVIESVQALTSDDDEWRTLSGLLRGIYRQHEALAWNDVSEDFRPDLTAPLSRPTLNAAFASTDNSGEYVYFESSREFRRRRDQFGELRSFITGWLWRRSSATPFQLVTVRPATNDADGKGPDRFHPLGAVRQGGQQFWLGTLGSYAYGALVVFDVRRAGIKQQLIVEYAGC